MIEMRFFERYLGGILVGLIFLTPLWIWGGIITVGPGGDYQEIQTAIDHSLDGDEIVVSPGRYYENIFMGMNIILRSTDPQNPEITASTVIDGNFSGTVVTFDGSENTSCVLTGFTITNGEAPFAAGIFGNETLATITNNNITTNTAYGFVTLGGQGGGIYDCDGLIENNNISSNWVIGNDACGAGLADCDGVIGNNIISRNVEADYLGKGGGLYNCQGTIEKNTISFNSALSGGALSECHGTIQDNLIISNDAENFGGAIFSCHGIIQDNTISNNLIWHHGGGLSHCHGWIRNNVISHNRTFYADGRGGGLYSCNGFIQNNIVSHNTAGDRGGGLALCSNLIQNNTITDNVANIAGGLSSCQGLIVNCVIWGNTDSSENLQTDSCSIPLFSCIQNWNEGGRGNITSNPELLDPLQEDYHLSLDSPCIDSGKTEYLHGNYLADMDGECRLEGISVDMGADEFGSRADMDGDLLPDEDETFYGSYPDKEDSDDDGLSDGAEQLRGTNPMTLELPSGMIIPNDFNSIQEGIFLAFPFEEVTITSGTYHENLYMQGKNIILQSADPFNRETRDSTIIDGEGFAPVLFLNGEEEETCIIQGLTLRNGAGWNGGGIRGSACLATIQYNLIKNNLATYGGGGIALCDGVVQHNRITGNSAGVLGGGLYSCHGVIQNNFIHDNMAEEFAGGGLYSCQGMIQNNMITDNLALWGGGICSSHGIIQNNTIAYNNALYYGGGLQYCDAAIQNCILWGNTALGGSQIDECFEPLYCCIQDWNNQGLGNISFDPLFIDPDNRDLHLDLDSPCIDSGMGVTLIQDFELDERPFDAVDWEMRGDGSDFDIGADEFMGASQPTPTPTPSPTPVILSLPFCDGFESGDLITGNWESMGNVIIVSNPCYEGTAALEISGQNAQVKRELGETLRQGAYSFSVALYSTNNAKRGISLVLANDNAEIARVAMDDTGSITATNGEETPIYIISYQSNKWYYIYLNLRPIEGSYDIIASPDEETEYGIAWDLLLKEGPITRVIMESGEETGYLDSFCLDQISLSPDKPVNLSPDDGSVNVVLDPLLQSSAFVDSDAGDYHWASQWWILADSDSSESPIILFDSRITTTALTSLAIPKGLLNYYSTYFWRVRYQDNHGVWSAWSDETSFNTQEGGIINHPPQMPENWNPPHDQAGICLAPCLKGSPFQDQDAGDFLTGAQWRIHLEMYSYTQPVYKSGILPIPNTRHTVPSGYLKENETYYWQVRYRDSRGAFSDWSQETMFKTLSWGDLPVPEGLYAAAGARSVFLTWILSRDYRVIGYNLYRAAPGSESFIKINMDPIRGNEYLDKDLTPFTLYRYCLTTLSIDDRESIKTNPVPACVGATRIFMSNIQGKPGETVSQMLTLDNPNDIENENLYMAVVYDKNMLTPLKINKTLLTESFSFSTNLGSANGELYLSGVSSGAVIKGEGHIMELLYQVNPSSNHWSQSDLWFDNVTLTAKYNNASFPLDIDYASVAKMTVAYPYLPGDLNNDGLINLIDATILQRIILGEIIPTEHQKRAADINGDSLNDSVDLVLLMRMISEGTSGNYPPITHCSNKDAITTYIVSLGDPVWSRGLVSLPLAINEIEGIGGLEIALNFNPGDLELVLLKKGMTGEARSFDYYENNGHLRILLEGISGNKSGPYELAELVFRSRGIWKQSPVIIAKLKMSGENGENLNRTKDIKIFDSVLTQKIPIVLIDFILGKKSIAPTGGDINKDALIDIGDLVRFIQD